MPAPVISLPKTTIIRGAQRSAPLEPTAYDYGYRPVASQLVTQAVTPEDVASILLLAEDGEPAEFLELAERMEEKDLNYRSVLATRKLAVTGMDVVVEAASEDAVDIAAADLVREVLTQPASRLAYKDILDALGKGYSVCQILWETTEKQWRPAEINWCNPAWFRPSKRDGRTINLVIGYSVDEVEPLQRNQFIVHTPSIKSSIVIKRGLARVAIWVYIFKNFAVKDWVRYSELNGIPFRLGKYMDKAHRAELLAALKSMGTDAYGVIPDTAAIEFITAPSSDGSVYERLCEWADRQVAIGILGQYGTVQSTPGQLGNAEQHQQVREDIQMDDAVDLAATLTRDLVTPLIRFNLGDKPRLPLLRFQPPEVRQPELLVTALERLVPLGLGVEAAWARDQFGIPDPEPGAELLGTPAPPPVPVMPAAKPAPEDVEEPEEPEDVEEPEEPEAEVTMAGWRMPEAEPAGADYLLKTRSDWVRFLELYGTPKTAAHKPQVPPQFTPAQEGIEQLVAGMMATDAATQPIPMALLRDAVMSARDELDLTEKLALLAGQRNDYDAIAEQAMFAARLIGFVAANERTE